MDYEIVTAKGQNEKWAYEIYRLHPDGSRQPAPHTSAYRFDTEQQAEQYAQHFIEFKVGGRKA